MRIVRLISQVVNFFTCHILLLFFIINKSKEKNITKKQIQKKQNKKQTHKKKENI